MNSRSHYSIFVCSKLDLSLPSAVNVMVNLSNNICFRLFSNTFRNGNIHENIPGQNYNQPCERAICFNSPESKTCDCDLAVLPALRPAEEEEPLFRFRFFADEVGAPLSCSCSRSFAAAGCRPASNEPAPELDKIVARAVWVSVSMSCADSPPSGGGLCPILFSRAAGTVASASENSASPVSWSTGSSHGFLMVSASATSTSASSGLNVRKLTPNSNIPLVR